MDVFEALSSPTDKRNPVLKCIDMQTTGEPTRIVISGYPDLTASLQYSASPSPSTLLAQREYARSNYDHLRRALLLEPRGHYDMYGAILCPNTELVASGEADIGVLFLTNDGYSTMCGHATIALGRFLLDTLDTTIFPRREHVSINQDDRTATLNLHAPCGAVKIRVPIQPRSNVDTPTNTGSSLDWKSDPTRPVSFISTPSFATGTSVTIAIPAHLTWPELQGRTSVTVDFAYGGAFYCLITASQLGFPSGLSPPQPSPDDPTSQSPPLDLDALNTATRRLKSAITTNPSYKPFHTHPVEPDLSFLYSIMVVDPNLGSADNSQQDEPHTDENVVSQGAETGLCFFADQSIDRSPTGSAVAARIALAYAKGTLDIEQKWTYHSLLSVKAQVQVQHHGGDNKHESGDISATQRQEKQEEEEKEKGKKSGAFTGMVVDVLAQRTDGGFPVVRVEVEGYAYYTGCHNFVVEGDDPLGMDGFVFGR